MQAHDCNLPSILVADDDPDYQVLLKVALSRTGFDSDIHYFEDGEQIINYLRGEDEFNDGTNRSLPGLILLDLNMPKKDGSETVNEIKSDPFLRSIPIVVLTTSSAQVDLDRVYDLGANSFVTKPANFERLAEIMESIVNYWFQEVSLPPPRYIGSANNI